MDVMEVNEGSEKYFNECVWAVAIVELQAKQSALAEKFKQSQQQTERMEIMQQLNAVNKAIREKKLEEFYVR